jgi:predicted transcriptional regulator
MAIEQWQIVKAGLSQQQLAKELGVSQPLISNALKNPKKYKKTQRDMEKLINKLLS